MFSFKHTLLALILAVNMLSLTFAQTQPPQQNTSTTTTSNSDNTTPTGAAKGVNPLGSYGGSNFDKVNLFNGNVSMSFSLASLTSRGGMSVGVVLTYNSKLWRVEKQETEKGRTQGEGPDNNKSVTYHPVYDDVDRSIGQLAAGWTIIAGRMRGNQSVEIVKNDFTCVFPGPKPTPKPKRTLTTFTFTSPDGTEYDFRDVIYDGQPKELVNCEGISRGREFISKDGTAATFISDTEVFDSLSGGQISAPNGPNGFVYLRDGSRFRIEDGLVKQQRDHNGNIVRYDYDGSRLILVTDNMGRTITVEYNLGDGILAKVTVLGIGATPRITYVKGKKLANNLAPNFFSKNVDELFPVGEVQLANPNLKFNPKTVSEVILPNGNAEGTQGHKWEFKYNSYGEVVYAKTPARGVVEFEMGPTPDSAQKGGYIENLHEILRRVVERRTRPSDIGPLEGKTTYSDPRNTANIDASQNLTVFQEDVDPNNANARLSLSSHKFSGHPTLNLKSQPFAFRPWLEGKELRTEQFNFDGSTVMRRSVTDYEQLAGVTWIPGADTTFREQPENNPRVIRTTNSLLDGGNKTSKADYEYDGFNNVIKEVLTGYNNEIIRQVERTYVTNLNGIDYPGLNVQAGNIDTHLRSLVSSETIKNASSLAESVTKYEYDNYNPDAFHASLIGRSLSINTHAQAYQSPNRIHRGNITAVTAGFGTSAVSTVYSQYDVLGNVVATLGPLDNQKTTIFYEPTAPNFDPTDNSFFTFPVRNDQQVRDGNSGNRTLTSRRKFDFSTGAVLSSIGFNNDTTTFQYNDLLDRLTLEVRPLDTQEGGFGRTEYTYSTPGAFPNSVTVETSLDNGRVLTSKSEVDGFLRTIRQTRTDGANDFSPRVISETFYDALGRVSKVTNPFRMGENASTEGYTTSQYDALSRVFRVQTFDRMDVLTGTVNTVYETNLVTVTDQALKQRKSETDGAGRLIKVYEPNPTNQQLDQITSYSYDARSNLTEINQGSQTRLFTYDSLSRLTSASSPESGTSSANGVTTYRYDEASNLIERKDPRNITTTYTYDSLNRLATKDYSDSTPDVTYFYDVLPTSRPTDVSLPENYNVGDGLGRIVATATPTTATQKATASFYSYDIGGRIISHSQLLDQVHYKNSSTYNLASLPTTWTYPSQRVVSHSYNIAGQIVNISRDSETLATDIAYTASGAISKQTLGNGLHHQMTYNSRLQPTSITLGSGLEGDEAADKLKLEYDYGFYDTDTLKFALSSPNTSPIQNRNNGNVGRIRITHGDVNDNPGGGGSIANKIKKSNNPGQYNLVQLRPTIEQYFAYDELNRLKVAKEFGVLGTPLIATVDPIIIARTESTTVTLKGYNLNNVQQILFLTSQSLQATDIISSSGQVRFTLNNANSDASGSQTIKVITPAGESDPFNIFISCANVTNTDVTGDATSTGSIIEFSNVDKITGEIKAHSEGSVSYTFTTTGLSGPVLQVDWQISAETKPNSTSQVKFEVLNVNGQVVFQDTLTISVNNDGVVQGNGGGANLNTRGSFFVPLNVPISSTITYRFTSDVTGGARTQGRVSGANIIRCNSTSAPTVANSTTEPNPQVTVEGVTWSQIFNYDRYANRISVEGEKAQTLLVNTAKNRLNNLLYDLAGNVIEDQNGIRYEYDAENRLVKSIRQIDSSIIVTTTYHYDGDGRRVKKQITSSFSGNIETRRYLYDSNGRLIAEDDSSRPDFEPEGFVLEQVYGPSGLLLFGFSYITPDHLGSTRIRTSVFSTNTDVRYDYHPFGEEISFATGNRSSIGGYFNEVITQSPFSLFGIFQNRFTSYQRDDETGLDFAQARQFSATLGRFMQPDEFNGGPVEFFAITASNNPTFYADIANPQTLNKYHYCLNNPQKYVDPSGHQERADMIQRQNMKDLMDGKITAEQYRKRSDAAAIGAVIGAAIVVGAYFGVKVIVPAVVNYFRNNPDKAKQIADEAVQMSTGNPAPTSSNVGKKGASTVENIIQKGIGEVDNVIFKEGTLEMTVKIVANRGDEGLAVIANFKKAAIEKAKELGASKVVINTGPVQEPTGKLVKILDKLVKRGEAVRLNQPGSPKYQITINVPKD